MLICWGYCFSGRRERQKLVLFFVQRRKAFQERTAVEKKKKKEYTIAIHNMNEYLRHKSQIQKTLFHLYTV